MKRKVETCLLFNQGHERIELPSVTEVKIPKNLIEAKVTKTEATPDKYAYDLLRKIYQVYQVWSILRRLSAKNPNDNSAWKFSSEKNDV
jgi:hypothetical protein